MILYIDATGKYVAKQDEAKRSGKGWHQVEVPTTDGRQALADYLNAVRWSEQAQAEPTPIETAPDIAEKVTKGESFAAPSYAHRSVAIDEAWEKLPLAQKLSYAAMAMEDARNAL